MSSAKLRSKTVGIGIWTNSLCGMLANIIIPYLYAITFFHWRVLIHGRVNPNEANLGGYVGFIFGGLAFAGSIWAYFFIPETRGRTVDECVLSPCAIVTSDGVPQARFIVREAGACEAFCVISVV